MPVTRRPVPGLPGLASGKVIEYAGHRHVHLANITGAGEGDVPFRDQALRMFERADACLKRAGVSFDEVLRTWIYIADIERDYEAFNPVRTAFYEKTQLARIPASTGIQGGTYPAHAGCMMDVYAVLPGKGLRIERMRAPTMNEATAYGSTFSRGMLLRGAGRTTAYVSGTASIDEFGRVVHVGDVASQVRRMLENVAALLAEAGARLEDLVSFTTYLKSPESLDAFQSAFARQGLPADLPNTITVADVCRPEWLCEVEAIAVFPGEPT
jgi:enamine deaminase RidA (YjgF/YER057c/UK114 family)